MVRGKEEAQCHFKIFVTTLVLMVLAAACDTPSTVEPSKPPPLAASVPARSAGSAATAPMTVPATQLPSPQPSKTLTWKSPTGAPWADYLGVRRVKTLDPSGPALVKPQAGDLFFFTNSGTGWGATNPKNSVVVFDAKTKRVVAVSDLPAEYAVGYSSHSVGVSADGKWVYLPAMGGNKPPLILILDARTLKIAKVYQSLGRGHHVNNFTAPDGRELINYTDFGWNFSGSGTLFFDPNDDHQLLGGMSRADFSGHPYVISREAGDFFYATVPAPTAALRETMEGYLAKVDARTLQVVSAIPVGDPVWPEISQDGKTAWVTLGGHGKVAKIDLTTEKVVAEIATGPGPWGTRLSCDEAKLYVADKGEAIGYNQLGRTMTVIDTKYAVVVNVVPVGTTTDHILLSPDCKELWATSNSEHAIYILDAATEKVKQVLRMPNGGDTHGGTWVRYFNDPAFVPRTKAGKPALVFYLSQTTHYNDLRDEPIRPILRVDGERAVLPVEANILADSVHHRTWLLLYPLQDNSGRALITGQTRQLEIILPDVDGVPVGQNRVTWDLPIVYPDGLGTNNALSLMALFALAAGMMAALSPCLLQQTLYYLSTMVGVAAYETNRQQRTHSARLVPTALAFVMGFAMIYTATGAIAGAAGQAVRSLGVLTAWNRPIAFASGVMLIGMALWLAVRARAPVVCHLPFPKAMRDGKRFGLFGTMLMGAGIALGCVTCFGGAVFAALMFYLGSTGSAVQGAMAMFIFSIGVAVPYLLSAVAFSRVAPLLERIQHITPYLALGSAAVVLFFGIVMITDNFHTLSNGVYRMLLWF